MKLKSRPEDFVVEELTSFRCIGGPFAFYRLSKRGLGTPEASQAIIRAWNLPRDAVRHGGLKDRHAETTQFLTILKGPQKSLEDRSFRLEYLGQAGRHYASKDIDANRFNISLRGLSNYDLDGLRTRLADLKLGGLVNYFDDQRFGSLGFSNQFIAQPWCLGDYERALYLAIADGNVHDRPREKIQKDLLRSHWGNWAECKDKLDRSHRRSIVTFLVDHPTDFKRAMALLRPDLRSIYVSAFQSYLWNRWLSAVVESRIDPSERAAMETRCGKLWTPNASPRAESTTDAGDHSMPLSWLEALQLPLPSARQHEWPEEYFPLLESILSELNMDIHQVRLKFPRDTFFSRGLRSAWLKIRGFRYEFQADDERPDRQKLSLTFELPRGAYATMLVKHLKIEFDDEPIEE
jgi:tRNA pseudouridine13 synthase